MSPSNSPCAACKIQRRKCTQDCVFAPYFPPDNPQRFSYVHKVFGASNVAKLLSDLNPAQREDAVKSLAYEAEARLRDPVYGCVGVISVLQHRLKQVQAQLLNAKKELASYIGPPGAAVVPHHLPFPPNPSSSSVFPPAMIGIPANGGQLVIHDPQQHQILEAQAQQLTMAAAMAAREQHEMMQQEILRLNDASASEIGFNEMPSSGAMSPSMLLGPLANPFHINQTEQPEHHHSLHHQLQAQLMLTTHQPDPHQSPLSPSPPPPLPKESEEGVSRSIAPSC